MGKDQENFKTNSIEIATNLRGECDKWVGIKKASSGNSCMVIKRKDR